MKENVNREEEEEDGKDSERAKDGEVEIEKLMVMLPSQKIRRYFYFKHS